MDLNQLNAASHLKKARCINEMNMYKCVAFIIVGWVRRQTTAKSKSVGVSGRLHLSFCIGTFFTSDKTKANQITFIKITTIDNGNNNDKQQPHTLDP